jgi:hypothetical protein
VPSLLDRWRAWAIADAEDRGIAGIAPVIEGLAASLARLRAVDWVEELQKPAAPRDTEGGGR